MSVQPTLTLHATNPCGQSPLDRIRGVEKRALSELIVKTNFINEFKINGDTKIMKFKIVSI